MYYENKLKTLSEIFGTSRISVSENGISVNGKSYPVVDDVIVMLPPEKYSPRLKRILKDATPAAKKTAESFAESVQQSFGKEWENYGKILPEHKEEFYKYFDIVDINSLKGRRACDLGCGSGRFSFFLKDIAREIICVDFSDAIFIARKNLSKNLNVLFFMADLTELPFAENFADFIFCLGVLHHLPTNALDALRKLKNFSKVFLVYLYYALDNRPFYFQFILKIVTLVRLKVSKIKNERFRKIFSQLGAYFVYFPLVSMGKLLEPFGIASMIPLYDSYHGKSLKRIEQDVYDRFFTAIEQRFTRKQIYTLRDSFAKIVISKNVPYWHFLVEHSV